MKLGFHVESLLRHELRDSEWYAAIWRYLLLPGLLSAVVVCSLGSFDDCVILDELGLLLSRAGTSTPVLTAASVRLVLAMARRERATAGTRRRRAESGPSCLMIQMQEFYYGCRSELRLSAGGRLHRAIDDIN
jgi:hypothetical protein